MIEFDDFENAESLRSDVQNGSFLFHGNELQLHQWGFKKVCHFCKPDSFLLF